MGPTTRTAEEANPQVKDDPTARSAGGRSLERMECTGRSNTSLEEARARALDRVPASHPIEHVDLLSWSVRLPVGEDPVYRIELRVALGDVDA